jgi:isoleucyl-tRNA synthetase
MVINIVAPNGDYSEMLEKINNMLKKSKNNLILTQLQDLQSLIKSKTTAAQ